MSSVLNLYRVYFHKLTALSFSINHSLVEDGMKLIATSNDPTTSFQPPPVRMVGAAATGVAFPW